MTTIPAPEELGDIADRVSVLLNAGEMPAAAGLLTDLYSADAASIVAQLSAENRERILARMLPERAADVLGHLDVEIAADILLKMEIEQRSRIMDHAEPEVAVDLLHGIGWEEASRTLTKMSGMRVMGDLLIHEDDDAGGLMSPDFAALRDYWTARHSLRQLSNSDLEPEDMRQVYVVDAQDKLVGKLELSELVFASPNTRLREIMSTDVLSVLATDDQEEVVRLAERYELVSIPVVNQNNQMEGVIAISDLIDVAEQEATEDMFRIFGVGGGLRSALSVRDEMRSRFPWLMLNLATVMIAGFVLSLFESTLDTLALLAVFLPVVMGQAGIAGTQTLTIIVRSLALGERTLPSIPRLLVFELMLSISQGLIIAVVLGVVVYIWKGDPALTLLVIGALLLNLMVAALSGVLVPMGLRLARVDPAMASAVIVTTATDVLGIIMYLGLATIFITILTN